MMLLWLKMDMPITGHIAYSKFFLLQKVFLKSLNYHPQIQFIKFVYDDYYYYQQQ